MFLLDVVILLMIIAGGTQLVARRVVPEPVWRIENPTERQRRVNLHMKSVQTPLSLGWLALVVVYHIPLRRMLAGTPGYLISGLRLVDSTGRTPDWRTLVRRFLLAVPPVLLLGASYLVCSNNLRRQAFHDQWSGTWVIRRRAAPLGPATRTYHAKFLGPIAMTYVDLEPVTGESGSATDGFTSPSNSSLA